MPLEIRELHIKVTVNEENGQTAETAATPGDSPAVISGDKSAIVAACVEQVMEILKEKMEA